MHVSFPYVEEKGVSRPKIPITLSNKTMRIETFGILDSGSDLTIIPLEIAEALGMELSGTKQKIKGIGDSIDTTLETINVDIKDRKKQATFLHIINMPVRVSAMKDTPIKDILLGRIPLFEHFIAEFDETAKKVTLHKRRK